MQNKDAVCPELLQHVPHTPYKLKTLGLAVGHFNWTESPEVLRFSTFFRPKPRETPAVPVAFLVDACVTTHTPSKSIYHDNTGNNSGVTVWPSKQTIILQVTAATPCISGVVEIHIITKCSTIGRARYPAPVKKKETNLLNLSAHISVSTWCMVTYRQRQHAWNLKRCSSFFNSKRDHIIWNNKRLVEILLR